MKGKLNVGVLVFLFAVIGHASAASSQIPFKGKQVQPSDLNTATVDTLGACDLDAVRDTDADVHERAKAAVEYERCMKNTLAAIGMAFSTSANLAELTAFQSLESRLVKQVEAESKIAKTDADFMGLKWGLGFGYSLGTDDVIEDAEIVEGVVRVKDDRTDQARVLFEFHQFFWCNKGQRPVQTGCGPFVAVAATSDDLLKGVGVGFMYGWKSKDPNKSDGFSIGLGALLDNEVRSLADGFIENEAPPAGETSVRFKSEARWSALILITRSF